MTRTPLLVGALLAIGACKSKPATVDEIAAQGKDHLEEIEQLRKDMAADGIRAVGYKTVQGASGMSCTAATSGEFDCTMPASASKKTVKADDVPAAVGLGPARYKSYLKLLDAVKGQNASIEPSGVLVIVRTDANKGLTWCPGSPSNHATNCHRGGRKYTAIDNAWYAWE
jgi:hypothetical protein